MSNKTDFRRTLKRERLHHPREEAILELVFNDEQEALCNEEFVLNHQRHMPAIQEFLEEMSELDSCGPRALFQ